MVANNIDRTHEAVTDLPVLNEKSLPAESDTVSEISHAAVIQKKPKKTWRSYFWDTFDKSPEERRFLFKLDAVILTFASLGYFIKYLDQVNVNNAFISGMQDDLNLYGNTLNYMTTCWTVGYVIGEIPATMLLTKVRPSILIPACEVTWSVLTIIMTRCTNAQQIYVLRFFIGLAESAFYPGMQYVIGSWYRKDELAKRSCIFHASSALGTMFSGYFMAAVYNLNGVDGYQGWQWLFIINTVISLPIACLGFLFFPDVPEICRAWYLTEEEIAMARRRVALEGRANRGSYSKAKFKKIFSSWHIYCLTTLYVLFNNGNNFGSQPAFALWLKSEGYSVADYNTYPTLASMMQVIATFAYAWSSDSIFKGARWPPILFSGCNNIMVFLSLTVWNIPAGWKWACYILQGMGGGLSGILMAWAHEICADDNEERAFVIGSMNEMAYVFQAWVPLLIWKVSDSPDYKKGFPTMIGIATALITMAFVTRSLHQKELAGKRRMATVSA